MIDPELQGPAADRRPLLLIVDDEAEILVALEDLFEDEYRVLSASSGATGLALIAEGHDFAVVLSDQRMPEMPGNMFLAQARAASRAETMLLTGYADLSAVISAVNDGAIGGYVHKPWEPEALRAMVGAAADRFRLRTELAFEQAVFAGLSERSADAISVVDATGQVVRSNRRVFESAVAADDGALLAQGDYAESEVRRAAPDGTERWIRTRRIPFVAAGSGAHLLRIESDETERRQTEQALHQSEKLRALGTLAGGIAHDFNNLLAAVLGNLELATRAGLGGAADPERLSRFLNNATEAARRGTALTQRLLSFSRQRDLAAETFAPAAALRAIEDLVVRSMAGQVAVRYDIADDAWQVHADRGQFELAMVNLCINARDASPGGGEILLSAANAEAGQVPAGLAAGDYVRIAVIDHGTGMSEAVRMRVYEPFFTTKGPGEGTGLGLPMVHAMAEAAGGTTTIDSVLGEGTTVALWLPRVVAGVSPAVVPDAAAVPDGRLRVLLSEDDAEVRSVVAAYLADLGHAVVSVESGARALAVLAEDAGFDVLVTDYAMPGMSGLALTRRVRTEWPGIAVLLVTGFAEVGPEAADVTVITKPFSCEDLQRRLVDAMAGAAA
ncbi:response regulator [Sphingomonas montana]|uniref:response regulator n=1 Tax=Sphingomonas montana TaxID=1843236 RepID=UPI00096D91DB|nr:response regulator [Sphingomonas montana]